jgi:EmrB/QacA subfamily drug resistance transporter
MGDLRANGTRALLAAILGSSMSFIDGTAVNVALPVLQRDLNASAASVQWVVEGYSLFLSALILIGGVLGDRFGRRRVFGLGLIVFAGASVACGLAPNVELLILARCIQGVGGALAVPGSLALISTSFEGAARGRAIGTWSGASALTSAFGPVLGGWLVQSFSWRAVFFINVPLAIVALVLLRGVRETRDERAARSLDWAGAVLATSGLGALVYGLIRLEGARLDGLGLGTAFAGCAFLAAFVFVERREAHPMLELDLFRSRTFTVANLYTLLLYAGLGGAFYFLPFELINVRGYSPFEAGATLLPFVVIVTAFSRFSGGLIERVGARLPLVLGALFDVAAYLTFGFAGSGGSYWTGVFPGAVLLGLGGACFVAPLTTAVMGAVDEAHAGLASGINNAVSRTAGLIAIAAFGIVVAANFERTFADELARAPALSAATQRAVVSEHAQIVTGVVPADIAHAAESKPLTVAIHGAYTSGFSLAMFASAGLCAAAALLAWFALPPFGRSPAS